MKNLKKLMFGLSTIMLMTIGVNAETKVNDFEELKTCLSTDKSVCTLDKDISGSLDSIIIDGLDVTLNLNNHNITQTATSTPFKVKKGNFTVTGKGTISAENANIAITVYGSTNVSDINYTTVTIDKDVVLIGKYYGAFITHNNKLAYGVTVNISGELKSTSAVGFYVNGNIQDRSEAKTFTNFPVVNIKDGAKVAGIYAAGYATWNIGVAEIKGTEFGLGVKAGKFVIDGATIVGTSSYQEPVIDSNGMNGTGAGIQIETNSAYADNIDITIKNATVTSKDGYAVLEYDGDTEIKNFVIENGTFTSASDKDVFSFTKNFKITKFITGGTFSTDVKDYIKTGYVSNKVGDTYKVLKESSVTVEKVTAGKVEVDKTKALEGEKVTLTLTPNDGYKLSSIKVVDTYNKEVSVTENTFVMPNSDVTITVEFVKTTIASEIPVVDVSEDVKDVTVGVKNETKVEEVILETIKKDTALSEKINGKDVTVGIEIARVETSNLLDETAKAMQEKAGEATIAEFFDITIALKDTAGTINETISELSEEIEVMVLLPEELRNAKDGMTRKYFIVREHIVDGESQVDLLEATVSEDGKYLVFKTNKFSTYAIAYRDVPEIENPKTSDGVMLYVTLGFICIAAIGISLNTLNKRHSK